MEKRKKAIKMPAAIRPALAVRAGGDRENDPPTAADPIILKYALDRFLAARDYFSETLADALIYAASFQPDDGEIRVNTYCVLEILEALRNLMMPSAVTEADAPLARALLKYQRVFNLESGVYHQHIRDPYSLTVSRIEDCIVHMCAAVADLNNAFSEYFPAYYPVSERPRVTAPEAAHAVPFIARRMDEVTEKERAPVCSEPSVG